MDAHKLIDLIKVSKMSSKQLILGIDASNIRAGGGVTHLVELLKAAQPEKYGFLKVIVWSGWATLNKLEDAPWLFKKSNKLLNGNLFFRTYWQKFCLPRDARNADCNVLFIPGGSFSCNFRPIVTMSQNMLPFMWNELFRYGISLRTLKLLLLRFSQSASFKKADGLIFLTKFTQEWIIREIRKRHGSISIIPHGINPNFTNLPRDQFSIDKYSVQKPFRLIYISIVDVYKHQWHVAKAVSKLRRSGLPITLDIIGPAYRPALDRLNKILEEINSEEIVVRYLGPLPHSGIHAFYKNADMFIFASSCENMPNILLEGMASGLPIVCSDRGPMPEVLGNAGLYFNPESPDDIAMAIKSLIESPQLRMEKARAAFELSKKFSWKRCSDETFNFLALIGNKNQTIV